MKFVCTACGACCLHLDRNEELLRNLDFPYNFDENGRCEFLKEDNTCFIYKHRPDACRIDKMQERLKLTDDQLYNIMKEGCNKLMDEENIPKIFRIK